MKKAVFITNIPAHYRVALLNRVNKILEEEGIQLSVIFSRNTYKRRQYWNHDKLNFSYNFLPKTGSITIGAKLYEFGFSVGKILKTVKPDVVIISGYSILSITSAIYCLSHKIPYLIYSGETKDTFNKINNRLIRVNIRKYLINNAYGFLVYGTRAKEYIESYKIANENIIIVINSVDTVDFRLKISDLIRNKTSEKVELLYVGDLKEEKGIEYLIKAIELLNKKTGLPSFHLSIVGDGPIGSNLERLVINLNLKNITFTGKVDYNNIYSYYKNSDIFILPSIFEPFGLVLVEAAAAGLPLVASKYCGGAVDLIDEGQNGYIINPMDSSDFASKLSILIKSDKLRKEMGQCSKEIIDKSVNINIAAESFSKNIIKILNEQD